MLRIAPTGQTLVLLGAVGCAPSLVPASHTPHSRDAIGDARLGDVTRDRAAANLPTQWPPPVPQTRSAVAVLEAPRDPAAVTDLVEAFFEAVCRESSEALVELTTEDATSASGSDAGTPARAGWARRFSALDYLGLEPAFIARPRSLRVYTAEDIRQLQPVASLHLTPTEATQYVVVVPINSNDELARLFGPELQLLVDWAGPEPQIARFYEEFKLR